MSKETAEQKLLKLIETSSSQPATAGTTPQQDVAKQMAQAVQGGNFHFELPAALRFLSSGSAGSGVGNPPFGLREFNRMLLYSLIAVLVFLGMDLLTGMKSLERKIVFSVDPNVSKKLFSVIPPVKDLASYLSPIETRNIFQPLEKKTAAEEKQDVPPPSEQAKKIVTLAEKLKLVGVSWLDRPETASVMIEDTESGITYFVRQGEKVKDLTVKNIYTDRVVLTFEGEEITIKL